MCAYGRERRYQACHTCGSATRNRSGLCDTCFHIETSCNEDCVLGHDTDIFPSPYTSLANRLRVEQHTPGGMVDPATILAAERTYGPMGS